MEDGWEGGRTGRGSARGVRGSVGHEPLTPSRFLPRPASFRPVLRCRAHHPPPARHAVRCKRVTGEGRWLTVARRSEAQGPPLPARRGPAGVGAGLHLHEGDGELVAFPVVPVDPLRGERDKHVSPAKRGDFALSSKLRGPGPQKVEGALLFKHACGLGLYVERAAGHPVLAALCFWPRRFARGSHES